jgi:DNA-binding response OmpR family regulator
VSQASDPAAGGLRVFVAEDEFLLALLLEEDLRAMGCTVLGPHASLTLATEASRREAFDLAILDVNLNGEMVFPLADELGGRGMPVVLLSGYGTGSLPERFRSTPRLSKPYDFAALQREVRRIGGRSPG